MARTMNAAEMDERIDFIVDKLGCSIAEAIEIINDDATIDKGGRCEWEPSVEEEKRIHKETKPKVDRKPRATGTKRERKADDAKREVIAMVAELLGANFENVEVTNVEKTIEFTIGDESFSIDLKKHRKPKAA